jgi:beta-lactamase superfamily II metal-dependent hydrolase
VVLTSADDAHIAGLVPVLDRFDVRQIVQAGHPAKSAAAWTKWAGLVGDKGVPSTTACAGLTAYVDRDVALEIIYPPPDSVADTPTVVQVRAGNQSFLFADSASVDDQTAMLESGVDLSSAFLVAPSKLAPGFFEAVNPQYAILFAGTGARGQPSADLLDALSPATILSTADHGTIEFSLDGETIAVRTER